MRWENRIVCIHGKGNEDWIQWEDRGLGVVS